MMICGHGFLITSERMKSFGVFLAAEEKAKANKLSRSSFQAVGSEHFDPRPW